MIIKQLEKNLERIVLKENLTTGVSVIFGKNGKIDYEYAGKKAEIGDLTVYDDLKVDYDTIYDLSSVSKFFTLIIVLKMIEESQIFLDDKISEIDSRFVNLKNISVKDVLSYQIEFRTNGRLEMCKNISEVENLLFNVTYQNNIGVYSDLPAMILRILVEKVTKCDFWDLIKKYIIDPCDMQNTYIDVPSEKINKCISNNFEMRIINDTLNIYDEIDLGKCNDPKARIFPKNKFAGHAGIFSTIGDMSKLCVAFLDNKILCQEIINQIGINRTGIKKEDGTYRKYFGYLAYVKHPIRRDSEVHPLLSDLSFAFGGYTGNQLTIDPINKIFLFIASNRCHNRITQIIPFNDIDKYIKKTDDNIEYVSFNNERYKYSKNFVYKRDDLIINQVIEDLI